MYGSEIERDEKEYLTGYQQQQQQQQQPMDYNNYSQNSNSFPTAQPQHPLHSQTTPNYAGNFGNTLNYQATSNLNTNNLNSFDNVDISQGGRLSGSTPFGTVHEFVSVSNKVIPKFNLCDYYNNNFHHLLLLL